MIKIYKKLIGISLAIGSCLSFYVASSALSNDFNDPNSIITSNEKEEKEEKEEKDTKNDTEETANMHPGDVVETMDIVGEIGKGALNQGMNIIKKEIDDHTKQTQEKVMIRPTTCHRKGKTELQKDHRHRQWLVLLYKCCYLSSVSFLYKSHPTCQILKA